MYTSEKLAREMARNSFILNKKYFYNQSTSSLEIFAKKIATKFVEKLILELSFDKFKIYYELC